MQLQHEHVLRVVLIGQLPLLDGGAEAALTGFTGYLEVLLPNKANYYRAAATISGNAATVTVDESKLCSIPGYTDEAYFAFEKNGVRYSTERFAIENSEVRHSRSAASAKLG